jgi:16S rRNA (adenine(1408)-N(1))-methyltransferase
VSVDLGTGDGRLPYVLARQAPERLFIGVDANAAGLRELSGRAARAGSANLLYVRGAVEDLPPELTGVADRVTVVLPWGSLLAAVARPTPGLLRGIRALCQKDASLTVVLASHPERDRSQAARLGLGPIDLAHLSGPVAESYAAAGLAVTAVRPLDRDRLSRWPSTWARRMVHAHARAVFQIEARAMA